MADKKEVTPKSGKGQTALGIDENLAALLAYLLTWVTGLIFILIEKENKFVRLHALQSLITFLFLTVVVWIPVIGWILAPFVGIVGFILWILLMVKAYQGERYKLPVVGDIAERSA